MPMARTAMTASEERAQGIDTMTSSSTAQRARNLIGGLLGDTSLALDHGCCNPQHPCKNAERRIDATRTSQHAAVHHIKPLQSVRTAVGIDGGVAHVVAGNQGTAGMRGTRHADALRETQIAGAGQITPQLGNQAQVLGEGRRRTARIVIEV